MKPELNNKNIMRHRLSDAAISWINKIICFRISAELILSQDENGNTSLRVEGSNKSIQFFDCDAGLRGKAPVNSCVFWACDLIDIKTPSNLPLPVPSNTTRLQPILSEFHPMGFRINCDIPGIIYWCLTRIEEEELLNRDRHNRFSALRSHAYKYGYLERPVVDEWIDVIGKISDKVWHNLKKAPIKNLTIAPSHDVDFPCKYSYCKLQYILKNIISDLLVKKRIDHALTGIALSFYSLATRKMSKLDPYNTFDEIMTQSEVRGLNSTFYMVSGGRHKLDPGYSLGTEAIRRLMKEIHSRGHSLGLHPSYNCIDNPELMEIEFKHLLKIAHEEGIEQDSWGIRMHYLRDQYPNLWEQLDRIGIAHDATMGYADRVGFRAGTAHEYNAFNHKTQKEYNIIVKPLVIMEGTLYSEAYMNLSSDAVLSKISQLKTACKNVNGEFSLLWHNSELHSSKLLSTYLMCLE